MIAILWKPTSLIGEYNIQFVNENVKKYLNLNFVKDNYLIVNDDYNTDSAYPLYITDKWYIIIDLSVMVYDMYELENWNFLYPKNEDLICGIVLDNNFNPLFEEHTIFLRTLKKEKDGYSFICLNPRILIDFYDWDLSPKKFLNNYYYDYRCKSDFDFK